MTRLSGKGMVEALDRAAFVLGLGTGAVDCSAVAPVKLAELVTRRDSARYRPWPFHCGRIPASAR